MAANRSTSKSKGKSSAATNAQQRGRRQKHLPEAPATSRSNKGVDQDRAADESPLQGADRPARGHRGKLDRTDATAAQPLRGRTKVHPGEQTIRRSRGIAGDSRR